MELNLSEMSKFVFPTLNLVTRLKDGSQDLIDPDEIKKHSLFQEGKTGFSLILNLRGVSWAQEESTGLWRPQTSQEPGKVGACTPYSR